MAARTAGLRVAWYEQQLRPFHAFGHVRRKVVVVLTADLGDDGGTLERTKIDPRKFCQSFSWSIHWTAPIAAEEKTPEGGFKIRPGETPVRHGDMP